jgi:hypothetical protein
MSSWGTTPAISWIEDTVTAELESDMIISPSSALVGGWSNFAEVWRYVIAFRKSPSEVFTRASTTYVNISSSGSEVPHLPFVHVLVLRYIRFVRGC